MSKNKKVSELSKKERDEAIERLNLLGNLEMSNGDFIEIIDKEKNIAVLYHCSSCKTTHLVVGVLRRETNAWRRDNPSFHCGKNPDDIPEELRSRSLVVPKGEIGTPWNLDDRIKAMKKLGTRFEKFLEYITTADKVGKLIENLAPQLTSEERDKLEEVEKSIRNRFNAVFEAVETLLDYKYSL